jgi:hypothetical protein
MDGRDLLESDPSPGDFVSWRELQPHFKRINVATRNHLLVVVAACWGFHGIRAMIDRGHDGVSPRLLAGPRRGDLKR